MTYVLTTARLDATGHRWLAALAAYDFEIKYRPGTTNIDADLLSRLPKLVAERVSDGSDVTEQTTDRERTVSQESISALCQALVLEQVPVVEMVCASSQVLTDSFELDDDVRPRDLRVAQRQDGVLGVLLPFVSNQRKPSIHQLPCSWEAKQFVREFPNLVLRRGVLHRVSWVDGQQRQQLVLPKSLRAVALRGLHNDVGHLGRDKTLELVRERYYWPRMATDVEEWVRNCMRCKVSKGTGTREPLVSIVTTQPLELVCLDYLTLEMSKGGYENVLVITDHFTRYALAIPTRNQSARTTAEAFVNGFAVHYGLPLRIHTDQGRNFESKLIREMCAVLGIEKSHTTPYHPMGNGMTEKFNSTLISMLKTLEGEEKGNWKAHIAPLVHAYNATRHASTKHSPFFLMFGRQPRLPVDLVLGSPVAEGTRGISRYVETLRENLRASYEAATAEAEKARVEQKRNYDSRARKVTVEPGDRVLVRILAHEGRHKLSDRWESTAYTVLEKPNPDIPVYVVKREDGQGSTRTLHRNHLLLVSGLPVCEDGMVKQDVAAVSEKPLETSSHGAGTEAREDQAGKSGEELSTLETEEFTLFLEDSDEVCQKDTVDDAGASSERRGGEGEDVGEYRQREEHQEEEVSGEIEEVEDEEVGGDLATEDGQGEMEEVVDEDVGSDLDTETSSVEVEIGSSGDESGGSEGPTLEQPSSTGSSRSSQETTPKVRRSTRSRKKPQWLSSGEFVSHQQMCGGLQVSESGWEQRAEFLAKLAMADSFGRIPDTFCQAILKIVMNKEPQGNCT